MHAEFAMHAPPLTVAQYLNIPMTFACGSSTTVALAPVQTSTSWAVQAGPADVDDRPEQAANSSSHGESALQDVHSSPKLSVALRDDRQCGGGGGGGGCCLN